MQVALGPMELIEWQGLIKVFPACHVPACCWNAARSRAIRWNAAQRPGQHAGCLALRLAALARVGCSAPAAPLLPGVYCSTALHSAASVRRLDSPRSSAVHFDRNLCSPPKNSRPRDLRDGRPDAPRLAPRGGRLDVHHAVPPRDRLDAPLPFRCAPLPHCGGNHPPASWPPPLVGRDSRTPTANDPTALHVRALSALVWLRSDARAPQSFRARFRALEFPAARHCSSRD